MNAADAIEAANQTANAGRGSVTARVIVDYLRQGNLESAQTVYGIDGDKLRQYPELLRVIEIHLGCRMHYRKDCDHHLCQTTPQD